MRIFGYANLSSAFPDLQTWSTNCKFVQCSVISKQTKLVLSSRFIAYLFQAGWHEWCAHSYCETIVKGMSNFAQKKCLLYCDMQHNVSFKSEYWLRVTRSVLSSWRVAVPGLPITFLRTFAFWCRPVIVADYSAYSAGFDQDRVNWYCSLLTRRTVCGRAAGNTPRTRKQTEWNEPRSCTNSFVELQDYCSYKAPTTNHHINKQLLRAAVFDAPALLLRLSFN